MRPIDIILEIIRSHPEGMTTSDLVEIVYRDDRTDEKTKRALVHSKCRRLERYELITSEHRSLPNSCGWKQTQTVWRPA